MEYTSPWSHYVIDDFLPASDLERIQRSLQYHKEGFITESDDDWKINYKFLPDLPLAKYFLGPDFLQFLEKTTGLSLTLNSKSLVQLRLMTPESPMLPPHVDFQEEKSLVCLLYLSPHWTSANGGELVLLENENSELPKSSAKVVEPLANRMVLFRSENHHWHCVNKVKNWDRYSIIMEWLISE